MKILKICLALALILGTEVISSGKTLDQEDLLLRTQKLYSQAKDYYLQGKLDLAKKELLQILKLDSEDEIAQEFLKTVSKEIEKQAQKNSLFLKHYNLGKKYLRKKKWEVALRELRTAVETYPQHQRASQAIELWDKINQQIIREAKEKLELETKDKAAAIQKQEEELAALKEKERITEEKKEAKPKALVEKKAPSAIKEAKKLEEKPVVNLPDCIQIAICNSLPLKIAKEQVELAEMKLFEAWRVLFPAVVGEMRDTYGKTTQEAYEARRRNLQFQQLIFDGGRSVFRLHQAELSQKISQENFNAVKQSLIYEVERAYYNLIYLQNVVKSQKTLYEEAENFLDLTEKQYKAGYLSRLELLNLQSLYNQVGYSLVASQQALSLSKLSFQQILNLDVPFALEIESGLDYEPNLEISLEPCLSLALQNRPEIRISQMILASSKYDEKIAKRQGWPELSLVGSIGEAGEAYTTDILRMRDEWSILGKLSWSFGGSSLDYSYAREKVNPTEIMETKLTTEARTHSFKFGFLDNLDYYSKGKEAEIVFQKAMSDYNELRQKIIMEVKEAYFLYERAKVMLEAVKSKIKYYKKEVEIAELRKNLDIIPISEFLKAKINLDEQENAYLKALMEYHLALATLNRALGISFYYSYGRRQS